MNVRKVAVLALIFLGMVGRSPAQPIGAPLLAHYRFDGNALDATGNSPPFDLHNTEFINGTLLLNGQYEFSDPPGFRAVGAITGFSYATFAFSLDFLPLPPGGNPGALSLHSLRSATANASPSPSNTPPGFDNRPIVVGGTLGRWLAIEVSNGQLVLTLNNGQLKHNLDVSLTGSQWHRLVCSVNVPKRIIATFLDGRRLIDLNLPPGFVFEVVGTPLEDSAKEFTFANYSNATAFSGRVDNLRVYGDVLSNADAVRIEQIIFFPPQPDHKLSESSFLLDATANSQLPVSFQVVSGPASLQGNKVTLLGPGLVGIRAIQDGNAAFLPTYVEQSFLVSDDLVSLVYEENAPAKPIAPALVVPSLQGESPSNAAVRITANYFNGEDILEFPPTPTITGAFDPASATLTLTGKDTEAAYQNALRTVTYRNPSEHPSPLTRTVAFEVSADSGLSRTANQRIQVMPVNDPPVNNVPASQTIRGNTTLGFTRSNGNAFSVADVDAGKNLMEISLSAGQGVLTLANQDGLSFISGDGQGDALTVFRATLDAANNALEGLTYRPSTDFSGTDSLTITVKDGGNSGSGGPLSDTDSVGIRITTFNRAPSFLGGPDQFINEDAGPQSVANWATRISAGSPDEAGQQLTFQVTSDQPGLFSVLPSISLSGTLTYTLASNASGSAIITVILKDDGGIADGGRDTSEPQSFLIQIKAINDPPVLGNFPPGPLTYRLGDGSRILAPALTITDPDDATLVGAIVQIAGNYLLGEDLLGFTGTSGIKGVFDAVTGTLLLSGVDTVANYTSALRSVSYRNSNNNLTPSIRSLRFTVSDAASNSQAVTQDIAITTVNDPPTLSPISDIVIPQDTPTDPIAVRINDTGTPAANLLLGATSSDSLLVPPDNILFSGSGTDRTLIIVPASGGSGTVTITLTVTDLDGASTSRSFLLTVRRSIEGPILSGIESGPLNYREGDGAKAISDTLLVTHPSGGTIASATVRLIANYVSGEDVLEFADTAATRGRFDPASGTLTLSGVDTAANYQTALRAVFYRNTSGTPSAETRTFSLLVSDGVRNSAPLTRNLLVSPSNEPPVISELPDVTVNEGSASPLVAFKLGDPDSPLASLIVSGASSNPALLPSGNIFIEGTGADRALRLVPAVHRSGKATVSLTATDGISRSTRNLSLTVNGIPTLGEILDQVMSENTSKKVLFVVGDAETDPDRLLATATSSNPVLLPDTRISIVTTGSRRLLSLTPAPGQFGRAGITLSVSDGTASAVRSFDLTVLPVTAPPSDLLNVPFNGSATFRVNGRGVGRLRYQWRHNGLNIPGATSDSYTVPRTQLTDAGAYEVLVTDDLGTSSAGPARLTLLIPSGAEFLFDRFEDARTRPITDSDGLFQFNNSVATRETGEPNHAGKAPRRSVWMQWISPPTPGIARFDTDGSTFDTVLAVYTGLAVNQLSRVASSDDHDGLMSSAVQFNTVAQSAYWIAVDGLGGASGDVVLNWTFQPTRDVVPVVTSQPRDQAALAGSTVQLRVGFIPAGASVQWFFGGQLIPGATGSDYVLPRLEIAQVGSYRASVRNQVGPLVYEASSEPAKVQLYALAVDVFAQDKFAELREPAVVPVQLQSIRRTPLSAPARGYTGTHVFSTVGATAEPGEPVHCGVVGGASSWYAIQAEATGHLTVLANATGFDPILAVYTDPTDSGEFSFLEPQTCNVAASGARSTSVTFPCNGGTIYYVACDGVGGGTGAVELTYSVANNAQPVLSQNILLSVLPLPNNSFKLLVSGVIGAAYTVQASPNLLTWTDLIVTNPPSGSFEFTPSVPPAPIHFRVKASP